MMRTLRTIALVAGYSALSLCAIAAAADQTVGQPPANPGEQPAAKALPQAFIMSKRVVYAFGAPVDLTFSIATPKEGAVLPDFTVVNEASETIEPREVAGLHFWESLGGSFDGKKREGALPAGQNYTETIADLREWYDLDAPGTYRVTFGGEWIVSPLPQGEGPGVRAHGRDVAERHALTSNTIIVRIARPPSEDEPLGEPTEGREIPIADIWALDMPGTRPMKATTRSIDPPIFNAPEGELLHDILRLHGSTVEMQQPAREGFVVCGTGLEALRRAHSILVEKNEPNKAFRRGEQVTLERSERMFIWIVLRIMGQ